MDMFDAGITCQDEGGRNMANKPVQLDEKGYRKFGIRDKLAYAAGDAGCNLSLD